MGIKTFFESLKPKQLSNIKFTVLQKAKSHFLTVSTLITMGGLTYGVYKLANFLKIRFGDNAYTYHQEIDDFIYDKMIRQEREKKNKNLKL